jgi:hypothetical protein
MTNIVKLANNETPVILANDFSPMAANLNVYGHRIINVTEPLAGSEVTTKGYVDRSLNSLENLPVNELTILNIIGVGHLELKGKKIRNLAAPSNCK